MARWGEGCNGAVGTVAVKTQKGSHKAGQPMSSVHNEQDMKLSSFVSFVSSNELIYKTEADSQT